MESAVNKKKKFKKIQIQGLKGISKIWIISRPDIYINRRIRKSQVVRGTDEWVKKLTNGEQKAYWSPHLPAKDIESKDVLSFGCIDTCVFFDVFGPFSNSFANF